MREADFVERLNKALPTGTLIRVSPVEELVELIPKWSKDIVYKFTFQSVIKDADGVLEAAVKACTK